ncbi:uncharacterized protein [Phaseolus vulgaris]|uniref:uncharacterized protein n=1 Tax=Phaseolus vulgaris TaxID=3885 RepID=UPI0035C9632A
MAPTTEDILRLDTRGLFCSMNIRGEFGYVDSAFTTEFQKELGDEWTLADSTGNVHIVHYNQNLLSPEIMNGWWTLADFYGFEVDHSILFCYVAQNAFHITVYMGDVPKSGVNRYLDEVEGREPLRIGPFNYFSIKLSRDISAAFSEYLHKGRFTTVTLHGLLKEVECKGDRIHVYVRKTLIYKFQNHILEDKVYSFNSFSVETNPGSYRTTSHKYKINFQFGIKALREINRTGSSTKLNVISIEADEMMEITKFPTQGLSQLCDSGKHNVDDEFIHLIPRNTIQGLKDCKEESSFVVLAAIKHIVANDEWYKLKVRVMDDIDSTTFVLFDRNATTLVNKSCEKLFDSHDKNAACGVLPKELCLLIDKVVLFKVGCVKDQSNRFEQSFRVKKNCINESIIQRFSDGGLESVELHSHKKRLCSIKDVEQDDSSIALP